MKKLVEAIKETFPEADTTTIGENSIMEDLPGWDSMNAINLIVEIESRFKCSGLSIEFSPTQTFGEFCGQLREQGLDL